MELGLIEKSAPSEVLDVMEELIETLELIAEEEADAQAAAGAAERTLSEEISTPHRQVFQRTPLSPICEEETDDDHEDAGKMLERMPIMV